MKSNRVYILTLLTILTLSGCSQKSIEYKKSQKASYEAHKEQYDTYQMIDNQTKKIKTLRKDVRNLTNEIAGDSISQSDYESMCYSKYNKYVRLSTEYRKSRPSLVYRAKQEYLRCEYEKKKLKSMGGR